MAALSVAPEPEPEPEPQPAYGNAGEGGLRAVVVYDYPVSSVSLPIALTQTYRMDF